MIPGLSTIKAYALAVLGILAAVFFGLFQREKGQRQADARKDAEVQRDTLILAEEQRKKAHQEGEKKKDEAVKKSESGDWSGFNDGV